MGNVPDKSRANGFDEPRTDVEEKASRTSIPHYSQPRNFPGHTDYVGLNVGAQVQQTNYAVQPVTPTERIGAQVHQVNYAVQPVTPTESKAEGGTREALERKRLDSRFPALIDGSGESPYPFFNSGSGLQNKAPRRTVVNNLASFDSNPYTVSDVTSVQRYSNSGLKRIISSAQHIVTGKDDEKNCKHYLPDPEQLHMGFEPRLKARDIYDTMARRPSEILDDDSWYPSEESSIQARQNPRSLQTTRNASAEKLAAVDNIRPRYTTHGSQREKHLGTARQAPPQLAAAQSFSGSSSEKHTLPKRRAHTTESKTPEGRDKTLNEWYEAPKVSQRYRQRVMTVAANRRAKTFAEVQEMARCESQKNVQQNFDSFSGKPPVSSPKREYPVAYADSALAMPASPAVNRSPGYPTSGLNSTGNARFPEEPIREDLLTAFPSHDYGAISGNPFLRESRLSATPGRGPDIFLGFNRSVPPVPSVPEAPSAKFGFASELLPPQQQSPLDSPRPFTSAFPPLYAARSSAATSLKTIRTARSNYGVSDPLLGRHGINSQNTSPIIVASPTQPQMQGSYRGVLNHIDRSSRADTLTSFSAVGIHCEKLCEKIERIRRMEKLKTCRAELLSAVPHDIGHIDRLVKACVQKVDVPDDPFAEFIEEAAKGAFKTVCKDQLKV
jgi:hypothetical protein